MRNEKLNNAITWVWIVLSFPLVPFILIGLGIFTCLVFFFGYKSAKNEEISLPVDITPTPSHKVRQEPVMAFDELSF
jgi:hypothetical protein